MNIDTGELRRMAAMESIPEDFIPVPKRHIKEANKQLSESEERGESVCFVSYEENSPLVTWAKKKSAKNKRKMAAASRRRNRK